MTIILNYGGGRQTAAICALVAQGVLPKPDRIIIADTGRENPTTWHYLRDFTRPAMKQIGLEIERIPPRSFYDLWSANGNTILIPVWLANGTMSSFCSGTWKRDRMDSYLRETGTREGIRWIGFAADEKKRINRMKRSDRTPQWQFRFPLAEMGMTTAEACLAVERHGWPIPEVSSCWLCPRKKNREWKLIRDEYPALWEQACIADEEIREEDFERGGTGMWLHHSLKPLRIADLDAKDEASGSRVCSLGVCFV